MPGVILCGKLKNKQVKVILLKNTLILDLGRYEIAIKKQLTEAF